MSISNYGELKTAVANWLHRSSLTARIPEFIKLAEDELAQTLRVRAMETSTDLSLTAGVREVALPSGFLEARRLYLNTDPVRVVGYLPPTDYWSRYMSSETKTPVAFTIEGTNFVFGPTPDTAYTGKLLYWKRFDALSADGDSNWILTNAGGLLLYGALIHAEPYLVNDQRLATWRAQYEKLYRDVMRADQDGRASGAPLKMRSGVNGG